MMPRFLSVFCLVAFSAEAGQITIGSNINTSTGISLNGLTQSYVTTGSASSCAGAQLNPGTLCATGSATGFSERGYSATLFSGAIDDVNGTITLPTPYSGYSATYNSGANTITQGTVTGNPTLTGNGVTFSMLQDSASATNNFWDNVSSSANSIVVPIGLSGIDQVWTMINDLYGSTTGGPYITVTFNFGTTSNGKNADNSSSLLTPVVVSLAEGSLVRDAINCTGSATNPVASGTCPANMATTLASSPVSLTAGNGETGDAAGLTATAQQITPTLAYTATDAAGANYLNTSGSVYLDNQGFNFGTTYLSDYLVSIQVSDSSGVAGTSRAALSAITVDQDGPATPEPSSFLLLAGGILAFFLFRSRVVVGRVKV
jgi:hypothetical protein